MSDRVVQPVAFTVRAEQGATSFELSGIRFPDAWKPLILELARERYGRDNEAVSLPVRSLNASLAALVPHLLTTPLWVRLQPDEKPVTEPVPWLLTEHPTDQEPVWAVIQSWLEHHFSELGALLAARDRIRPEDLVSEPVHCQQSVPVHDNGTANPPPVYFRLLPAWLAERLVDREVTLRVLGAETRLMRVPTDGGGELMTWPPRQHGRKGREGAYSYTVRISVQTHAGCPLPRVHFHYGVRRWVSRPLWDGKALYLGREAKSVYMRVADGWLGMPPAGGFAVANLQAARLNGARLPVWTGGVPAIASRLGVQFPSAEEFAGDPGCWSCPGGRDGIEAAAVEKTPKWHPVQPGLGLDDHEEITMRLEEALRSELALCNPMVKLPRLLKVQKHSLMDDIRAMEPTARLAAVARSVGPMVEIEVLYRTPEFRDWQVDRLRNLLTGEARPEAEQDPAWRPSPAPAEQELALPGGRLKIVARPVGEVGAPLAARLDDEKVGSFRRRATDERIRQIERATSAAEDPALSIIDLPDYRFRPELQAERYRDPRLAIRLGYAHVGRLTKFVDGRELEALRHRCEAVAREALRQLGYLPAPIGLSFRKSENLPERLLVAAVWVIRLNRTRERKAVVLPVVVLVNTADLEVRAWLPDGKGIRPYYRAELDIVRLDPASLSQTPERKQLDALRNFLLREVPREGDGDILILADAQNCRKMWPGMRNDGVRFGNVVFDEKGPVQPVGRLGVRMRLVRLRTSERGETPEWFTYGAGPNHGYSQGIWEDPGLPCHYLAIGEKPPAMRAGRKGKQMNPGEFYAQPSILEILPVALQPEIDSSELWARAVYEWKQMSGVLTEGSTLRPLQLEFARHMSRYARAISPYVDPALWTEPQDGEGAGEA